MRTNFLRNIKTLNELDTLDSEDSIRVEAIKDRFLEAMKSKRRKIKKYFKEFANDKDNLCLKRKMTNLANGIDEKNKIKDKIKNFNKNFLKWILVFIIGGTIVGTIVSFFVTRGLNNLFPESSKIENQEKPSE